MNRKGTKCKTSQYTSNSEDVSISQKDELPGVDFKNKLGPRSLRHNRLNLSTTQGETRFLHSVTKELSQQKNVQKLQNAFQLQSQSSPNTTALACKQVWCSNQEISVNFSSPLENISTPTYIQKWQNSELIKEIPQKSLEEDQDDVGALRDSNAMPTVIAVNLKWRNGIQVKQLHKFSTRTTQLEPVMRKTDFDYETKTKFSKEVELACEELFPDWKQKLMILDGNDSHGLFSSGTSADSVKTVKAARSDKLQEDATPSVPLSTGGDPHTRQWKEFTDMEEHRILVVPSHSKNGFDMDLSKQYQFPYQAKFVIGRRAYHHKFFIRLPLSKSPQHFGLIFTFSEDPKGHSKLRIKSLLTVYSIRPQTPKYACLETYELETSNNGNHSSSNSRAKSTQATRAAKNAVQLLSENLKEENVTTTYMNAYELRRELPQAGQNHSRFHRLYDESLTGKKQKKRQQMQRNIKMEQARC